MAAQLHEMEADADELAAVRSVPHGSPFILGTGAVSGSGFHTFRDLSAKCSYLVCCLVLAEH